jgi:hypothetical protein
MMNVITIYLHILAHCMPPRCCLTWASTGIAPFISVPKSLASGEIPRVNSPWALRMFLGSSVTRHIP